MTEEELVLAHRQYERAMERRRPGTALPLDRFVMHVANHADLLVESKRGGFVFGCEIEGVFYPSHFAPVDLRDGVDLIKLLAQEDTVLFVPEDLASQAERLGFKRAGINLPATFRGETMEKVVLYSSRAALKGAALLMYDAYERASYYTSSPSWEDISFYLGGDRYDVPIDIDWDVIDEAEGLDDELLRFRAFYTPESTPIQIQEWA